MTSTGASTEPDTDDDDSSAATTEGDDDPATLPRLDVLTIPDAPGAELDGCRAIDFLFVIDNSPSMSDEQDNLTRSFPGFFSAIATSLEQVSSYHVGVVTTDDYVYNVSGCTTIGSLVVRTGGSSSFATDCGPYEAGHNYMTSADHLPSAFKCAGKVGTDGSGDERPMLAMLNAVDGSLADDGECNEGFVRDNALLVIVVITDEIDYTSPGTAGQWFGAIVDTKGGYPENVAVVALTPDDQNDIVKFAQLFEQTSFIGLVEVDDYGPLFVEAIDAISYACENFVPAG